MDHRFILWCPGYRILFHTGKGYEGKRYWGSERPQNFLCLYFLTPNADQSEFEQFWVSCAAVIRSQSASRWIKCFVISALRRYAKREATLFIGMQTAGQPRQQGHCPTAYAWNSAGNFRRTRWVRKIAWTGLVFTIRRLAMRDVFHRFDFAQYKPLSLTYRFSHACGTCVIELWKMVCRPNSKGLKSLCCPLVHPCGTAYRQLRNGHDDRMECDEHSSSKTSTS